MGRKLMSFSSLHSESDEDFEGNEYTHNQPQAGLLLQQFNDAWINNKWHVEEAWFEEGFQFVTPLFTHTSFDDFTAWFNKILASVASAEITHQYTADNCSCCLVNVTLGDQASILRVVQLVTFENNKISEIEWIFDPREVFEIFSGSEELIELA
jgi:hypothetical protein